MRHIKQSVLALRLPEREEFVYGLRKTSVPLLVLQNTRSSLAIMSAEENVTTPISIEKA